MSVPAISSKLDSKGNHVQVKKILVPKRENPIINRLNKTKVEKFPDLRMEREERLKVQSKKTQAAVQARVSLPDLKFWPETKHDAEEGRGTDC